MKRVVCGVLVVWSVVASTRSAAQSPTRPPWRGETGMVALQQAVRDAQSDTRVLLVASHPDDTYLLPAAYLRFALGHDVAVVLFTRGKGGQNSQGPETGDSLGRVRTLEAEAGAAHLGIQLFYLNRPDGGFCRTAAEALDQWGRRSTAEDLAALIRTVRPDILMTTHHPEEPHGHDIALLDVTRMAVDIAADPAFERQGTAPFQTKRYFRGAGSAEQPDQRLAMAVVDPVRGRSYRELAYSALQEHASQQPLQAMEELFPATLGLVSVPLAGVTRDAQLFRGLPDLWQDMSTSDVGAAEVAEVREIIDRGLGSLDAPQQAKKALRALTIMGRWPITDPAARVRWQRRVDALNRIVLEAVGFGVTFKTETADIVAGDRSGLEIHLQCASGQEVEVMGLEAMNGAELKLQTQLPARVRGGEESVLIGSYTAPRRTPEQIQQLFVTARFEPPLRLRFWLRVGDQRIVAERIMARSLVPSFEFGITPQPLLLARDATQVRFVVGITRNTSRNMTLDLRVRAPAGMSVADGVRQVDMGQVRFTEYAFALNAPVYLKPGVHNLLVTLTSDGMSRQRLVRVHKVDVAVRPSLRVALIRGRDDTARQVLQSLMRGRGLTVFSSDEPLPIIDQGDFDTIVVDIRALRSKSLRPAVARLLDFVRGGGRLVVFYHKDSEFNLAAAGFRGAPYSLVIGKSRVTRQDAPIRILAPEHSLLNTPNKIAARDWDGWQQERGLYFPSQYDAHYQELLELADPGQPDERGSLLYARYGKGDYVYCALALYRQLKSLHAGACRLFANLVCPARPQ